MLFIITQCLSTVSQLSANYFRYSSCHVTACGYAKQDFLFTYVRFPFPRRYSHSNYH